MIKAYDFLHKCTFSPVIANGALNHCSKLAHDLKMLGSKKFSSAHNSGNLFCHIQEQCRVSK